MFCSSADLQCCRQGALLGRIPGYSRSFTGCAFSGTPAEAVVQGQLEEQIRYCNSNDLRMMMGDNPPGDPYTALVWAAEVVRRCAVPGPGGHGAVLLPIICALPQVLCGG